MINLRRHIYSPAFILLTLLLSSCRKDLCYNHFRSLKVHLEYEQVWERDYGINTADIWDTELYGLTYDELIPEACESVTVLIYDVNDEKSIRTDFIYQTDTRDLSIGDGVNSVLFYNNDTENVTSRSITDRKNAQCVANLASRSTYVPMDGDEITVLEPDMCYTAYLSEIPEISMHEQRGVIVKMQPIVFTYVFVFEFDSGIDNVALARGAISGMAYGAYYRDASTTEETATILFENCKIVDNEIVAIVRAFGPPNFVVTYYEGPVPDHVSRNTDSRSRSRARSRADGDNGDTGTQRLNLELMLTSGRIKEVYFNVSNQINKNPTGGIVHFTGLKVDDSENVGSSLFNVDVQGWGEAEEIPLPVTPSR